MTNVFSEKIVWITGASSGIGRSLAYAFNEAGARLILSARRRDALEEVKRTCRNSEHVHVLPFDLTERAAVPAKAEEALAVHGRVDFMVHNAGVALRDRVVDTDLDVDRQVMEINYFGPVALTKALLPSMLQRRSGCFVVISSLSGKFGGPQYSAYSASKHALHGFFESLRVEVHDHGIQITIIVPGFIKTPITTNALTGGGGMYGKTLQVHEQGMDPHTCANKILRAVARGRQEALIGGAEPAEAALRLPFIASRSSGSSVWRRNFAQSG